MLFRSTRGQEILNYESKNEIKSKLSDSDYSKFKVKHKPKIFLATEEENIEHKKFLEFIIESERGIVR